MQACMAAAEQDNEGARTVRHMGHLLEWSVVRAKQARQKVCPQGVVTGSNSSFMHRMHSTSSPRAARRALCMWMRMQGLPVNPFPSHSLPPYSTGSAPVHGKGRAYALGSA